MKCMNKAHLSSGTSLMHLELRPVEYRAKIEKAQRYSCMHLISESS